MEKEFVSFEIAVALKELRFKERSIAYYEESRFKLHNDISGWDFNTSFITHISAPLWQQAFDWFELNHGILVNFYGSKNHKSFILLGEGVDFESEWLNSTMSLYEAREACLKKLIEICKKN